jgi:ComF family protein
VTELPRPPSRLSQIGREVLDLLLPPHCAGCEAICRELFCPTCLPRLEALEGPYCPRCGHPHPPAAGGWPLCADCRPRKRPALDGARSALFHLGPARKAIITYKFEGCLEYATPLAGLLAQRFLNELARPHPLPFDEVSAVVPVVLHPARRAWRGFDQASLLSTALAHALDRPLWADVLVRVRNTAPQLRLSPAEREANIHAAFEARQPSKLKGAALLIVDDVYTTGATLREAARALKHGGAAAVYALTLTRAAPSWHPRAFSSIYDEP